MVLDAGNSQLKGGIFREGELIYTFRKEVSHGTPPEELEIFLSWILQQGGGTKKDLKGIAYSSVVPPLESLILSACPRAFGISPCPIRPGDMKNLTIHYRDPSELGPDRLAAAAAGVCRYPGKDLIVVDMGTATTIEVVTKHREYLGGVIAPGIGLSRQVLAEKTAGLPEAEFIPPGEVCGRSTAECIQAGLYFGHLGMIKEIIRRVIREKFSSEEPVVIGTGGLARHFQKEDVFDAIHPDLVLEGIYHIQELIKNENRNAEIQTA